MPDPILSVVTGTFNRIVTLKRLIDSVRNTVPKALPYEIIVADNGSTDGTGDWLAQQSDIRVMQLGKPMGAIKAFTEAAKQARGTYVLLATDDCYFPPRAIIRAIRHLEDTPGCGAVAFGHNKYLRDKFEVAVHAAHDEQGQHLNVIYPQIALVRRWLGAECGWWGGDHPVMGQAFTYGGDDFLGAGIWERGYTVEMVDGVYEYEDVIPDEGRAMNESGHPKDAAFYWSLYPNPDGHLVRRTPQIANPDQRQLRVLCALQYTPGHPTHRNKRAWSGAFEQIGLTIAYDYRGRHAQGVAVEHELPDIAHAWQPDIIFTQVHHPHGGFTLEVAHHLRQAVPRALMINWNGDYWPKNYLDPDTIEMLRYYDLQLVQNAWVLEPLCQLGICAAFIPHSFEPVGKLPYMPAHDAVWIGNGYNDWRKLLAENLHTWGVALYGGVEGSKGSTMYDFASGRALYYKAKVAISDMQFTAQARGYVSNRLWEILAAGGALCLQQHSPGLDELTGLRAGVHYVEWRTLDELHEKIGYYTDPAHEAERCVIVQAAYEEVHARHSFEARLRHLIDHILPECFGAKA